MQLTRYFDVEQSSKTVGFTGYSQRAQVERKHPLVVCFMHPGKLERVAVGQVALPLMALKQ
jgi:hypothetical protein